MRVEGDGKVNHMKLIANLFLKMQKKLNPKYVISKISRNLLGFHVIGFP